MRLSAATITEKTGWSTSLLITLIGLVVGAAGSFFTLSGTVARNQDDIVRVRDEIAELKKQIKSVSEQGVQHEIRISRSEEHYATILTTLGKFEEKLDRAIIPARGGGR
jgi:HAMP domain-containing protein